MSHILRRATSENQLKEVDPIPAEDIKLWRKTLFPAKTRKFIFSSVVGFDSRATHFLHINLTQGLDGSIKLTSAAKISFETFGFRKAAALDQLKQKESVKGEFIGLIRIYTTGGPVVDSFFEVI
jgi:hypothetical protein